jgi:hypothetical protein
MNSARPSTETIEETTRMRRVHFGIIRKGISVSHLILLNLLPLRPTESPWSMQPLAALAAMAETKDIDRGYTTQQNILSIR